MYLSTPILDAAVTTVFSAPTLTRAAALPDFGHKTLHSGGASQLERWSSLIGIVTAIIGNILISFALNIQRYAHIRLSEEQNHRREKLRSIPKIAGGYGTAETNGSRVTDVPEGERGESNGQRPSFGSGNSQSSSCKDLDHKEDSTYLQSPYWWGGIILMTVGEAGNFLAYGFAPASIVSPLGVVALISNCVIAPIMLKERFRLRDFWGVVIAVAGAVTVVLSAKQQEKKLGPHEIWGAITTIEFEIYMTVTVVLIAILVWASPKYGNKTILIDLGLVGLFGGYTALSTKGVASMLSSTLWRALTTPVTYALVAILVATAISQVKYVNRALQRFDSTQVIPVQFVMFTLSVIIGSAILYRDFEKATAESLGKFVGGCVLTFFGVWLITSGRAQPEDEDSDADLDEEGEERIGLLNHEYNQEETEAPNGLQRYDSVRAEFGDGAQDDEYLDTRRSSRVSFAEPPSRPETPRLQLNSSKQPPSCVDSSTPAGMEATPALNNLWKSSSDDLLQAVRHPGLMTMMSSPAFSSEGQTSADSLKPLPVVRTISHGNPHTHPSQQRAPAPPEADRLDRPMTPARHSISRMMPGPLLSPLSGGLSAVVADNLRRGVDSSRRSKRPKLGLRRTKSGSQHLVHGMEGPEEPLGASPLKNSDIGQDVSKSLETEGQSSRMTRSRSLSNTLGDLFRGGKRQKTDRPDTAVDEDAGPSGS